MKDAAATKSDSPPSPKPQTQPKANQFPDLLQDINSSLIRESHSDELAWFKAFFRGAEGIQKAPSTRLVRMLLDFARKAEWQKDEGVHDLLFAKTSPKSSWIPLCDERKLLFGLPRIHRLISGSSSNWDPKAYRCWTSGAVAMAIAFKGDDAIAVVMIGEMTARILLDLGDPMLAKLILDCTIEEMDELGGNAPSFLKSQSMLSLARCHFLLDNKDNLEDLLEKLFLDAHPTILKQSTLALGEMTTLRDLRKDFNEVECILENLQRGNAKISEKAHNNINFLKTVKDSEGRAVELERVSTREAERLIALGKDMEARSEIMEKRISDAKESFEVRMELVDAEDRSLAPWKWVDFEMESITAGIRWMKLHCLTQSIKDQERALGLPELPESLRNTLREKGEELMMKLVLFPLGSQCLDE